MRTPICDQLGMEFPILAFSHCRDVVAAVSICGITDPGDARILAGGLTPENVASAIRAVAPFAVDVISAVEDAAHRKVRERVRAFIQSATMQS